MPFEVGGTIPDDAAFRGFQRGAWQLWVAPSDQDEAIYMVRGDPATGSTWERWPAARSGASEPRGLRSGR